MVVTFNSFSSINNTLIFSDKPDNTSSLPPTWSQNQIWYQIFVERFYNGDHSNDPTAKDIVGSWPYEVPDGWAITPWTHDWYKMEEWSEKSGNSFYHNTQLRRFGGDLQGVKDKLDYLQDLGITAIYFNPLNHAPSLHKYDAASYHHIDANFGPDPVTDKKIMEKENPADWETWQWTTADLFFLEVVKDIHQRGMKVIVDFSWNHTGLEFWAWTDILKKGKHSKYAEWYRIHRFHDPDSEDTELDYEGWLGFKSLPELTKVDVRNREHGKPYEGNIHSGVKEHIFQVTKRWLAPNGKTEDGIDGFRLDVADQIPMGFWKEYRSFVKELKPEAYLTGEIWWEDYPEKLMNTTPYIGESAFDAVMFYQVFRAARRFFGITPHPVCAEQFRKLLEDEWKKLPTKQTVEAMMGVAATHDTPRLLTSFANNNLYKFDAKTTTNNQYNSGKPSEEAYLRTRLYLLHQFTSYSSPHIWNGDEMGMWGADDPDNRKPLWWPEFQFEAESDPPAANSPHSYQVGFNKEHYDFYKQLIQLRKKRASLNAGDFQFIIATGMKVCYKRRKNKEVSVIAFNVSSSPAEFIIPDIETYCELLAVNGKITRKDSLLMLPPMAGVLLGI